MTITETARAAKHEPPPIHHAPTGHTSTPSDQEQGGTQLTFVAEGQDSPQAKGPATPTLAAPAGRQTAQPAIALAAAIEHSLAGHQNGRDHAPCGIHEVPVPASTSPGAHPVVAAHSTRSAGGQASPVAKTEPAPMPLSPLADPLLALSADVLSDLEKVRIANENRLRQLTRSAEDSDGETRGFGLDESHPDVARLAALVDMLGQAEHQATLNLGRMVRKHPLGPWLAAQRGIGEKQGARLLAAIGDPYIRPEIVREDGTVEPSRPRLVSELWALCGYHVIKTPVGSQVLRDSQWHIAADGSNSSADHLVSATQTILVGGEQNGHPGHPAFATHAPSAGVAPKRARGQKANWSATAKMRAYLVAESCMKQPSGSRYRDVYEATRAKYAEAAHAVECVRCGPKGKPAQPGSALSEGHKHARALRAVAKEVLRDLWREAKRLHEGGAA